MTTKEYMQKDAELNSRFPTIELRPAPIYIVYKEFFLICICAFAYYMIAFPSETFSKIFLIIAIALTLVLFYKVSILRSTLYQITHDRIKLRYGVLGATGEKIEMYRICDVTWHKPLIMRILGYGQVTVHSTDKTRPILIIPGIRHPEAVMSIISDRVEINRLSKRIYEIANR